MKFLAPAAFVLLSVSGCSTTTTYDYNEPLSKAVTASNKSFRSCYRKHGEEKEAKLTVKFQTNYAGDIQFADTDFAASENVSPEFGECIAKIFRTIKMPEAEGHDGLRGTYTFAFTSK